MRVAAASGEASDERPKLAVVIPTFNRARTIGRAVGSVLATARPDIELAVIDDHSTDNTLEILSAFRDSRLIVGRSDRHGYGNRARNLGVERTTAPVIAFLDSDDEFLPGRIDRLIRLFEDRPEADAVLDGFHVIQGDRRTTSAPPDCLMSGDALIRLLVSHALPLTTSALAIRRTAFLDVGGFDGDLRRHQDRDLILRLASRHKTAIGTGVDVIKHQSSDSISRDASGYVSGLDDLVARHDVFHDPVVRSLLGYLIARSFVRELMNLRPLLAWRIARTVRASRHLPFGLLAAIAHYLPGRRARRAAEADLAAGGRQQVAFAQQSKKVRLLTGAS